MIGIFIFWIHYIVAIILLYTILFGHYDKHNIKKKHPVWMISVFILALFIPLVNIITFGAFMALSYEKNDKFKSFITKEY